MPSKGWSRAMRSRIALRTVFITPGIFHAGTLSSRMASRGLSRRRVSSSRSETRGVLSCSATEL